MSSDFACWILVLKFLVLKFSSDSVVDVCKRGKLLLSSVEWCLNEIMILGI